MTLSYEERVLAIITRLFDTIGQELQAEEVVRTGNTLIVDEQGNAVPPGRPVAAAVLAVAARVGLDSYGGDHVAVLENFGEAVKGVLQSPQYAARLRLARMPTTGRPS